jgi:hypothetical protein
MPSQWWPSVSVGGQAKRLDSSPKFRMLEGRRRAEPWAPMFVELTVRSAATPGEVPERLGVAGRHTHYGVVKLLSI